MSPRQHCEISMGFTSDNDFLFCSIKLCLLVSISFLVKISCVLYKALRSLMATNTTRTSLSS